MKILCHLLAFLATYFFLTIPVSAAIVINEIAWMGTTVDPNGSYCEWIELTNTGPETINLDGWKLSIGATTKIFSEENGATLSISPEGFYLIERLTPSACPDPVPNISADWSVSFGSGISNSGAIITLANASGDLIDSVDSSGGWLAGDNTTKETAQRSGNTWITAMPTPRAINVSATSTGDTTSQQESSTVDSTSSVTTTTTTNTGSSFPVEPQIFTSAGAHRRIAVVGGDITFSGSVWGLKKEPIENARMLWNFGDGGTAEGRSVAHTYKYPGTYIVVLDAASGFYSATDRVSVEVTPANISISGVGDATSFFVELYNESSLELDISGWSIRTPLQVFTFPQNTLIAPGKKVRFSSDTTGFNSYTTSISLHYPNGSPATTYEPKKISSTANPSSTTTQKKVAVLGTAATVKTKNENSQTPKEVDNQPNTANMVAEEKSFFDTAPENQTASLPQATENANILWWLAGVSFLALMGVAATILIAKKSPLELVAEEADTYTIVEDKEDEKIPF